MRKLLVAILVLGFPAAALAEDCVQSDGQPGVYYNNEGSDDDRCLTADEYAEMFSIDSLIEAGVVNQVHDMGDGTFAVVNRVEDLVESPLDRPVAANPSEFDTAPTVREVLYPATACRLTAMA